MESYNLEKGVMMEISITGTDVTIYVLWSLDGLVNSEKDVQKTAISHLYLYHFVATA